MAASSKQFNFEHRNNFQSYLVLFPISAKEKTGKMMIDDAKVSQIHKREYFPKFFSISPKTSEIASHIGQPHLSVYWHGI